MIQQIEPNVDMPVIRYGGVAYPVLFAGASVKRWAEYRGISFTEAVAGWNPVDLSDEDLAAMLRIALDAGELRRQQFTAEENHQVTDDLIAAIWGTYHLQELWKILTLAWSQPSGREPDPPVATLPPTGETSSD